MLLRIAICEDTKKDTHNLRSLLKHYLQTHGFLAEVECFPSGEMFLAAFKPGKYQLIFMDIFMEKDGLTGMDTADKIRETDDEVAIIFTTISEDYGIAGYDVATYYIVKPVTKEDIIRAMKKCHRHMERYGKSIEIMVNRQLIHLPLHHIIYIEAQQRTCVFFTTKGEFRSNMVFNTLVEELSELPFLRCHRSYIVNLAHVQDLQSKDFVINKSYKIPISRSILPEIKKKFYHFLSDELRGI